ncbi:efflux RND transporter periplasmic adaptor subunit [Runella salmonicolor]|uniref:Efflux RND transporter periplasmic adaptor subunit n=1 Tax=Runella salmonicolor TaxID=2950278 RepID=A0ABT1FX57_9BACT|nr:efflux RND transporter periplasmic adaptor subunit [Runella salmonicolor]MCP1386356.1 efflux RND transporter periplasmic adaptor subunit [Runella salmonicolor]
MKKIFFFIAFSGLFFSACSEKKQEKGKENLLPFVQNGGLLIRLPNEKTTFFFETETLSYNTITADISAPANVSATVMPSQEGASQNIILFENPALASNYTALIQHQINVSQKANIIEQKQAVIRQKQIELARYQDLAQNGAGTGKDVSDAKTDLIMAETELKISQNELNNERAAIIEHEAALKQGGFEPHKLLRAPAGTAYIICDIPESQISKVQEGSSCLLEFTAFPNEQLTGKIDDVADMIDQTTRMVKLRVSLKNNRGKLKAGMFATVSFGVNEGRHISVSKEAVVTIQGKNYVFIKLNENTFKREEITTGIQIGQRIIVLTGLQAGQQVAVKGVMQLKGLSFGY